jgi:hypothetical protein
MYTEHKAGFFGSTSNWTVFVKPAESEGIKR